MGMNGVGGVVRRIKGLGGREIICIRKGVLITENIPLGGE